MSGSINGTMNGAPCWSPAPRDRYDLKLTPSERLKVDLLELPRLIQSAVKSGLVKLPSKVSEPETPRQMMAAFPAAIRAAMEAGLVRMADPEPPKPKPVIIRRGPTTKPCKCGTVIHIYASACKPCKLAARPQQPCLMCGKMFRRILSEKCCSTECSHNLTGKKVAEAAMRRQPRPDQTCTVCGQQFPWRYTRTKLPAKNCLGACTVEAARKRMAQIARLPKKKRKY
jgi:hypothetical protein